MQHATFVNQKILGSDQFSKFLCIFPTKANRFSWFYNEFQKQRFSSRPRIWENNIRTRKSPLQKIHEGLYKCPINWSFALVRRMVVFFRSPREIDQAPSRLLSGSDCSACAGRALLHITSFLHFCVVMRDSRVSKHDDRVLCIPRIHRLAWCASSLRLTLAHEHVRAHTHKYRPRRLVALLRELERVFFTYVYVYELPYFS